MSNKPLTRAEHIAIHQELHTKFDMLIADFFWHTEKLPSTTTIMELIEWSFKQTQNPDEKEE